VGGTLSQRFRLGGDSQTEAVFNDLGVNYSFRVESDAHPGALYVDGQTDGVGINSTAPVSYASGQTVLFIEDTVNPAIGISDTGQTYDYWIYANGNKLGIDYAEGGGSGTVANSTAMIHFHNDADGIAINEDGANRDFRIESENNPNMFHLDANEDAIGIGIAGQSTVGLYVDKGASAHAAVFRVDSAGFASIICDNQASSGTRNFISFRIDNSAVGAITSTGSTTVYGDGSDYRIKENVNYEWEATTRLKQLKPVRFNFIVDPDATVDGFLAHEAQEVVPNAVTGTKDEVDDDGNAVIQNIDQSKLVPLLVKTIQELEARITALENS
jgi:hypothetical protein